MGSAKINGVELRGANIRVKFTYRGKQIRETLTLNGKPLAPMPATNAPVAVQAPVLTGSQMRYLARRKHGIDASIDGFARAIITASAQAVRGAENAILKAWTTVYGSGKHCHKLTVIFESHDDCFAAQDSVITAMNGRSHEQHHRPDG